MPQTPGYSDNLDAQQQRRELERITGAPVHLPEYTDAELPDALTAAEAHIADVYTLNDPTWQERAAAKEREDKRAAEVDDWYYGRRPGA